MMETKTSFWRLMLALLVSVLVACGGGGGGGSGSNAGSGSGPDENDSNDSESFEPVKFDLRGALAVLVYEEPIVETEKADGKSAAGDKRDAQGKAAPSASGFIEEPTNLVALEEDGRLRVALSISRALYDGEVPKVSYTVPSPDNRYLYVIMQEGVHVNVLYGYESSSSEPKSSNYCFLFKVDIATGDWSCLPVVAYGNDYDPDTSGFGAAVQFDEQGRTYIIGCALNDVVSWSYYSCYGHQDEYQDFDVFEEKGDGSLEALNVFQDDEEVNDVRVTKGGDVVYYFYKSSGESWKLWRNEGADGQVLVVGNSDSLGPLEIDDGSTLYRLVHTGYYELPAPVFMKPRSGGTLSFDRLLLGPLVEPIQHSYTGYLTVAGDGRFFVFTRSYYGESYEPGEDGVQLWQLLPRRELVLEDIEFSHDTRFAANLAISISDRTTTSHGVVDRLSLTPLVDGGQETLLFDVTSDDINANPNVPRYDINMITIDGHLLYFSALDLSRNMNIIGAIDLDTYNAIEGNGEDKIARMSDYLTIVDVGSASEAASRLWDIKVLRGPAVVGDNEPPVLGSIDFDSDNPYSVSLHFSKEMDQASVESHLQFVDESTMVPVPYMTLWLGNTLHLLVDLNNFEDATAEGLPLTEPLSPGVSYTVMLGPAASDKSGNMLANESLSDLMKTVVIDM